QRRSQHDERALRRGLRAARSHVRLYRVHDLFTRVPRTSVPLGRDARSPPAFPAQPRAAHIDRGRGTRGDRTKEMVVVSGRVTVIRLFVGGLPPTATKEDVFRLFRRFGAREETTVLPRDRKTRRKKGVAFVELESTGAAEAAIATFHGV